MINGQIYDDHVLTSKSLDREVQRKSEYFEKKHDELKETHDVGAITVIKYFKFNEKFTC